MYYIKHRGTEPIYFDTRKIFIKCVDEAIKLSEKASEEGFPMNISIGFAKDFDLPLWYPVFVKPKDKEKS